MSLGMTGVDAILSAPSLAGLVRVNQPDVRRSLSGAATAVRGDTRMADAAALRQAGERVAAQGESEPRLARDPVHLPIIENWVEAIGDGNPVYTDPEFAPASVHGALVPPPTIIQVCTIQRQRRPARASVG